MLRGTVPGRVANSRRHLSMMSLIFDYNLSISLLQCSCVCLPAAWQSCSASSPCSLSPVSGYVRSAELVCVLFAITCNTHHIYARMYHGCAFCASSINAQPHVSYLKLKCLHNYAHDSRGVCQTFTSQEQTPTLSLPHWTALFASRIDR